MLKTLTIHNIALIENAECGFDKGLNILSGETGAGKSIIIDSLNFVLGGRADRSLIRYGAEEASVEAEFEDVNASVRQMLEEYEIDYDGEVILSRKMTLDGRNTCRINGVKLTVATLKSIAGALVDIYGQHENSILLNPASHLKIVDVYGYGEISEAKSDYTLTYARYNDIKKNIAKYGSLKDVNRNIDTYSAQINEIKKANIQVGEEERLSKTMDKYENVEIMLSSLGEASTLLNGDMDSNALEDIVAAMRALERISDYDDDIKESLDRLIELKEELRDIASEVSASLDAIDFDEYDARDTDRRLTEIRNVMAKYGDSEEEVLEYLEIIEKEYDFYANAEFELQRLIVEEETLKSELYIKAKALNASRQKVAKRFADAVVAELKELGMGKTVFEVSFRDFDESNFISHVTAEGCDSAEFLISPNLGQPLKPLSKIISGGEMSRFMLAIKKISADIDGVNVMVFDEIDTGISGNIATVMACKLYDISKNRQVLAVTHLPQLASMADNHYKIEKYTQSNSTYTSIIKLSREQMEEELARMTGGVGKSDYGLLHAKELKDAADRYKSN